MVQKLFFLFFMDFYAKLLRERLANCKNLWYSQVQ